MLLNEEEAMHELQACSGDMHRHMRPCDIVQIDAMLSDAGNDVLALFIASIACLSKTRQINAIAPSAA